MTKVIEAFILLSKKKEKQNKSINLWLVKYRNRKKSTQAHARGTKIGKKKSLFGPLEYWADYHPVPV